MHIRLHIPYTLSRRGVIEYVQELLNGHPNRIYNLFRMETHVFLRLCNTLESLDLLHEDRYVGV